MLCINRKVFLNDRASLPRLSLRGKLCISLMQNYGFWFANDAIWPILHHWRIQFQKYRAFPSTHHALAEHLLTTATVSFKTTQWRCSDDRIELVQWTDVMFLYGLIHLMPVSNIARGWMNQYRSMDDGWMNENGKTCFPMYRGSLKPNNRWFEKCCGSYELG